jgi:flagellar motility protein MotE (MotC chaperone)
MGNLSAVLAMMMPFLLGMGGVAAWRASKRSEERERERAAAWRDDSLDEWRRERERIAEEERARRATEESQTHAGSTREGDEKKQHQRIGG